MVATGTDIKPIEIVMFLRAVKSRVLFEQMKSIPSCAFPPGSSTPRA
jgi:hypothetical protein